MGEARDVEPAVVLEEGYQVEGGEIARRVVEEHVLRAVVDHETVGDEMPGRRLGKIEHRLLADRLKALQPVLQRFGVGPDAAVELGEARLLRAAVEETDRALEDLS